MSTPSPRLRGYARVLLSECYKRTQIEQVGEFLGVPRSALVGSNKSDLAGRIIDHVLKRGDDRVLSELFEFASGDGPVPFSSRPTSHDACRSFLSELDAWRNGSTSISELQKATQAGQDFLRRESLLDAPRESLLDAPRESLLDAPRESLFDPRPEDLFGTKQTTSPDDGPPARTSGGRTSGSHVSRDAPSDPSPFSADVAFICALHLPELDKLLTTADVEWRQLERFRDDPQSYWTATLPTANGLALRALAAAPRRMGMSAAAILTTKIIMRFRPRLVVMVGITAGSNANSQGYGDILAADLTIDYSSGKITAAEDEHTINRFLPDPTPLVVHGSIVDRLKEWERQGRYLDEISRSWSAQKPVSRLTLRVGPLASGAAVVDDRKIVDEVRSHWRKLVGLEMEAHGVHAACQEAITPAPLFMCMKSISDFAHHKNDQWREYAAYTSANIAVRFVREEWSCLVS